MKLGITSKVPLKIPRVIWQSVAVMMSYMFECGSAVWVAGYLCLMFSRRFSVKHAFCSLLTKIYSYFLYFLVLLIKR